MFRKKKPHQLHLGFLRIIGISKIKLPHSTRLKMAKGYQQLAVGSALKPAVLAGSYEPINCWEAVNRGLNVLFSAGD